MCLKVCDHGYKRQGDTCEPCGFDHYKKGKNTNTECTQCNVRGTTGDNNTATSEESCLPKVGYSNSQGGGFNLLPGYRELQEGTTGCQYNYKRDSDTSECTECPGLLNGNYESGVFDQNCSNIICNTRYVINSSNNNCILKSCNENEYLDPKGDCINIEEYGDGIGLLNSNLILSQNYSWNGTRSTKCPLGEKRDDEHTITPYNFYENITCTSCPSIEENKEYIDGYDPGNNCMWDCINGYEKNEETCLKVCDPGYKRYNDTCIPCGEDHFKSETNTNTNCTQCRIYPKHTTNDNTTARNISECLIECGDGKYRNENSNTCTDCPENTFKNVKNTSETCTPCDDGYTTNGLMGQTSCTLAQLQCSSDNQYYDETYCPANSSYDTYWRYCTCNPGYEVNSTNDGCEVSSPPPPTMKDVGQFCSNNDECYSDNCDLENFFQTQKTCIGRGYNDPCDTANKHCKSKYLCVNDTCSQVKMGYHSDIYNGGFEECESGTTRAPDRYSGGFRCEP